GEDLNMAAVLTWGPGWYHQRQNFTGQTSPLSKPANQMHYDVEVSGFPSSHAGHLVLLNLKEDDYPSTTTIEDWPSWTYPVLQWARKQQALTGYAHSGWGLEPINGTTEMPTNVLPKMDGIGANEYIVTVTQNLIDFYSAGDTPAPWELNMWYHTLNCGFRTRLSGETDFPCIFDERVGIARSYFKATAPLNYEKYIDAIKNGKSYVSDGRSHLIDFSVNGREMGEGKSQLDLSAPSVVKVKAKAVAMLPEMQSEEGVEIASRSLDKSPYWHIERARMGRSRNVAVELIFNGRPVDSTIVSANGKWNELEFKYTVKESGWFALRIFPSAHTNPIFVVVNKAPVRVAESINWCIGAVDQCWKNKQGQIRKEELSAAESAYKQASGIYNSLK
ncbi:MAG TPA: CehA/McbA family metallohydrolase, partial [Flavitalea sp.]|nr:CehA/McbA family metallohydrolase [Flavitalea sp.]